MRNAAEKIALIGLAALIIVSPWAFGGVRVQFQQWLFLILLVTLFPCAVLTIWEGPKSNRGGVPLLVLPLLAAAILGLAQLVPLSQSIHARLTPQGSALWELAGVDNEQVRYPITLYPNSTRNDLAMLALSVGTFVIASLSVVSRGGQIFLCGVAAINGAAVALFGIVQQLTSNGKLFWTVSISQGGNPFASFVNRNHCGGYLNLCLAASLALLVWTVTRRSEVDGTDPDDLGEAFEWGNPLRRMSMGWLASLNATSLLAITLTVCIAAGVVCSLSRGAILAMVCATCITAIAAVRARGSTAVAGMAVVVLAVGVGLAVWLGRGELLRDRLVETVADIEIGKNSRIDHWQDVLAVCRDFWLTGSGIGTYRFVYRPYESQVYAGWFYHAENQYLEALVETGWLGLSLVLAAIALAIWASLRLLRWRRDHFAFAIGIAGLFGICSQAIHSFFDFGLYMPANAMLCAAIVGMAAAQVPPRDPSDDMWVTPPGWATRTSHAGVMVLALVWVMWGGWQTCNAARVDNGIEAVQHLDGTRPCEIGEATDAARRLNDVLAATKSSDVDARFRLADLYVLKYRAKAYAQLAESYVPGELDESDVVWKLTSPVILHRRAGQLKQSDEQKLQALANEPLIRDDLAPAVEQLAIARYCCPILGSVHLALSELYVAAPSKINEELEIQTAVRLAPSDPDVLFQCGLLDLQSNRISAGAAKWKRCLNISSGYTAEILALCRQLVTNQVFLDEVVPESPERLVELARLTNSRDLRSRLTDKAETALGHFPMEPGMEAYLRGAISELRYDAPSAIKHYKVAVSAHPNRLSWRYELAVVLANQGLSEEAFLHATYCVRQAPRIPRYRDLLKRLGAMRSAGR